MGKTFVPALESDVIVDPLPVAVNFDTVLNATNVAVSFFTSVVQLVLSSVTSVVKVLVSVVVTSAVFVIVEVASIYSVIEMVSK